MGACHATKLKKKATFSSAKQQVRRIYDIQKEPIGKGAFAQVFKAELKTNPDIEVAVKVFEKQKIGDANLKAIKEEIKVLCKLDHPNIVKYYEVHEDDKNIFIVTEYIEGRTITEELKLREKAFSEFEVSKIVHQLVCALHHCHSSNIAHRDIKPDNVIIDKEGKVTLIDFGLSKSFSKERNLMTKAGSPLFMAPEVHYSSNYSNKCDIWGVGILIYILGSGNVPFSIKHYNQIVSDLKPIELSFAGNSWDKASKNVKKLLQRMIVVDPTKRISVEEVIDHGWFDQIKCESTMSEDHHSIEEGLVSIIEFESIPLLKHGALRYLVNLIPSNKLKEFQTEFNCLDEDNDGTLSFKDLKRSLKHSHPDIKNKEIIKLLDKLDFFKGGKIYYTDYLVARVHQSEFIDMKLVESVFKQFDSKCDGKIDKSEISIELTNMLRPGSTKEITEMIKPYDHKNRGYLNFSDFQVMITNP